MKPQTTRGCSTFCRQPPSYSEPNIVVVRRKTKNIVSLFLVHGAGESAWPARVLEHILSDKSLGNGRPSEMGPDCVRCDKDWPCQHGEPRRISLWPSQASPSPRIDHRWKTSRACAISDQKIPEDAKTPMDPNGEAQEGHPEEGHPGSRRKSIYLFYKSAAVHWRPPGIEGANETRWLSRAPADIVLHTRGTASSTPLSQDCEAKPSQTRSVRRMLHVPPTGGNTVRPRLYVRRITPCHAARLVYGPNQQFAAHTHSGDRHNLPAN